MTPDGTVTVTTKLSCCRIPPFYLRDRQSGGIGYQRFPESMEARRYPLIALEPAFISALCQSRCYPGAELHIIAMLYCRSVGVVMVVVAVVRGLRSNPTGRVLCWCMV